MIFILACLIFGLIGMIIGNLGEKKNGELGLILGLLFGPIGWIITAVLPPRKAGAKSNLKALLAILAIVTVAVVIFSIWINRI